LGSRLTRLLEHLPMLATIAVVLAQDMKDMEPLHAAQVLRIRNGVGRSGDFVA
jgi:hypothetical protein